MADTEKQRMLHGNTNYGGTMAVSGMDQPQPYPPPAGAGPAPYRPPAGAPGYPTPNSDYPPQPAGYPPPTSGYPPAPAGASGMAGGPAPGYPPDSGPDSLASDASAPPMEKMDEIAGYRDSNFSHDYVAPPPSYDEATSPMSRDTTQIRQIPVVSEQQAREALLQEVGKHCCWGKGPAEKLVFTRLQSVSAFHYCLESFTEARATKWTHEPYKGQTIDGIGYGPAPLPWDVIVPSPQLFLNKVHKMEVPHTASVKPCHKCFGRGKNPCNSCNGSGHSHCHSCNRTGRRRIGDREENCSFCHGHGRSRCSCCHGDGMRHCTTCDGRGALKCFIQLTVTRTNHMEDRVVGTENLPIELMRDVNGEVALQEENMRVWPINYFPDQGINNISNELVSKHQRAYPSERLLMQRHKIRIIPVTDAYYTYDGHDGVFYIYGFEQRAYAPQYPSTCCGCCAIL